MFFVFEWHYYKKDLTPFLQHQASDESKKQLCDISDVTIHIFWGELLHLSSKTDYNFSKVSLNLGNFNKIWECYNKENIVIEEFQIKSGKAHPSCPLLCKIHTLEF